MTEAKFKTTLETLLKKDIRLLDENKELNIGKLRQFADKTDEQLVALLLNNEETKKKFFLKVKDVFVFKQNDFKFFLDANQIDNSYTAYENKIGLSFNSRLLKDHGDVVLNFPYKDCVLEGGQSTEEGVDEYYAYDDDEQEYELETAPRKEIFFNEILAKDEIDRLLEPKAFTNIKKYTAKGEEKLKGFTRNEKGIIVDNLIIKGNNLIALHSLKEQFAGQVKLIYIDPPYNTGSDSFKYNDNFNHSTWLIFMKNRLVIAKDFLKQDGFIFISIDERENNYLRVLCDEVFGRENRVSFITVKVKDAAGVGQQSLIFDVTEYLLVYAKNIQIAKETIVNTIEYEVLKEKINGYKNHIKSYGKSKLVKKIHRAGVGEIKIYKCHDYKIETTNSLNFEEYVEQRNNIAADYNPSGGMILAIKDQLPENGLSYIEYQPIKGKNKGSISKVYFKNQRILSFLSEILQVEGKTVLKKQKLTNLWITSNSSLHLEGGVTLKAGKKPEDLLKKIIEFGTAPKDIVMDFHLGSGTSTAVAHKLGRQYIGIEQLDYGNNDSTVRLKNVIAGDNSGISKSVKWKGGGSFIYMELKKWNEEAKEKIIKCKSLIELEKLLNDLSEKYFLHYNVKFKEFKEKIIHEAAFKKLSLNKQQEMFAKMLDLNQLYVSAAEMEDKKYGLSKDDITLTKNFYKK